MARQWSNSPEEAVHRLFRRCVECPTDVTPSCPVCKNGETCSLKPQDCYNCPSMVCVKPDQFPGQAPQTSSTSIGGIVGGVAGGVVVILISIFVVWYFFIRKKKRQDTWTPPEKTDDQRSQAHLSRAPSIASTVMTRASNVIQIAYIPGVTVRSAPESPDVAPPMPSIPSNYAGTSANTSPNVEQHFFMPKDLRDSVWSDASSMMTDPRISIAPSLARASVATTIYHENAVPSIPAQYAYVAQASAVSVKSGSSTPNLGNAGSGTPSIPQMPQAPKAVNINGSSIVARNVVARPIEVKKSSAALSPFPRKSASRRVTPVPTISDEKEVVFSSSGSTMSRESPLLSSSQSIVTTAGPLDSGSASTGRPTTAYAEAMIHEAMLRATQDSSHSGSGLKVQRSESTNHDSGPFSDLNEIR